MMSALARMITPKTIALGRAVQDWQEAVRAAGGLLVQAGKVEPSYVEGMIRMVQEIGPYIVIAPGVALPHARPEDGVKEACMSLVTLSPEVPFGNETNDPVELVVAFGSPDSKGHMEALAELARLLENETALAALKRATSPRAVVAVVKSAKRR